MRFADYFDRILVLNLPIRADRLREMQAELDRAGMPLTPGRIEVFPAIRPDERAGFATIGARGCLLSHLAILKHARQSGWSRILVLEDDVAMSRRVASRQAEIVEFLERNPWDFVFFGHVLKLQARDPDSIGFERFDDTIRTTHFYAVRSRVFDGLIRFLEELQLRPEGHPDGGPMYPDGAISWFRIHNPDVVTWVANPNLGWQRSSRSDIFPNRWFDRVPIVKHLVAGARMVKTRIEPRD